MFEVLVGLVGGSVFLAVLLAVVCLFVAVLVLPGWLLSRRARRNRSR